MCLTSAAIHHQLSCLDFSLACSFITPATGTEWRVFAAQDDDSWWYEEPVVWEIYVASLAGRSSVDGALFYVCGTLLSPGVYIRTEREWAAALERLLPAEGLTDMESVD